MSKLTHKNSEFNKLLAQITAAAAYSSNEIALMEITLHHIMQAMSISKGMIKLKNHIRSKGLTPDVSTKINNALEMDGEGFCTSIVINNWKKYEGIFSHLKDLMEEISLQSSMIIPILHEQKCIGYSWISSTEEREWEENEIETVKITNQILGITTEKLHYQQASKNQCNMVRRLNNISKTFNRLFAFDEALTVVGNSAVNLLETNHAAIFLRNPDETISCPWQYALSASHISQIIEKEGKELINFCLTTPSPLIMSGQTSITLPDAFENYLNTKGIRTINFLPLIFDGNIVGSIGLFYDMPRQFSLYEIDIMETFANQAAVTLQNAWIYDQLETGYRNMALALADAVDQRSMMISEHSRIVAKRALEIAALLGCTAEEQQDIYWASLLHDIGKIVIPENVLQKPGPLSDEEWHMLQQYPLKGEEMLRALSQFENVGNIIRGFRERYDGEGYPDQLKGRKIPLGSRVLAVVDSYETMINDRPYQKSKTPDEAIEEITRCSGKQFDPLVVDAFLKSIKRNANILMSL